MSSPFELATSVERLDTDVYRASVPAGWEQGRGAFGGLVLGTLARAMIASEPDASRTLRMLSGEICGPVLAGECRIEVSVLRRGKNLTNLDARLSQSGQVLARASAGLSTARSTGGDAHFPGEPTAPSPPPFADVRVTAVPDAFAPPFARHFEYRPSGPLPFSGGSEPLVEGYVRERIGPARLDGPAMIALLDAYWPAILSTATRPRAAATVAFGAQLLCDPSTLDASVPLFHRARVTAQRDGFFVEMRELWQGATLVAMNQQTFALLG